MTQAFVKRFWKRIHSVVPQLQSQVIFTPPQRPPVDLRYPVVAKLDLHHVIMRRLQVLERTLRNLVDLVVRKIQAFQHSTVLEPSSVELVYLVPVQMQASKVRHIIERSRVDPLYVICRQIQTHQVQVVKHTFFYVRYVVQRKCEVPESGEIFEGCSVYLFNPQIVQGQCLEDREINHGVFAKFRHCRIFYFDAVVGFQVQQLHGVEFAVDAKRAVHESIDFHQRSSITTPDRNDQEKE